MTSRLDGLDNELLNLKDINIKKPSSRERASQKKSKCPWKQNFDPWKGAQFTREVWMSQ